MKLSKEVCKKCWGDEWDFRQGDKWCFGKMRCKERIQIRDDYYMTFEVWHRRQINCPYELEHLLDEN